MNFLPSAVALGLVALVALLITSARRSPPDFAASRRTAARAMLVAVAMQAIHFAEEAATGFYAQFGPQFGVPSMPLTGFVAFNVAWLLIWLAAVPQLRAGRGWAFFVAWFLAIAGVLNAIAHPLLALAVGDYFPGLISAPLIGLAGVLLGLRLLRATKSKG